MQKTVFGFSAADRRPVRTWYWLLLVPLIVWMAREVLHAPPPLATLAVYDATLARRLELIRPTGRAHGGPYVRVAVDAGVYRIDDICVPFALNCTLAPELSALDAGDRIRIWSAGERIWQMGRAGDDRPLVAYSKVVRAYDRNRLVVAVLIVVLVGLFTWRWRAAHVDR
jgi:hypothetical protein